MAEPVEDLTPEASGEAEPDETEPLPIRAHLPPASAPCPRGPCLKRSGSGSSSDFGGLSLKTDLCMTPASATSAAFRCFSGTPLSAKRQVHFDESAPEAGVTHSSVNYDRTPIESTQGKGSSLDLSIRRCKSKSGEEGESEAEDAERPISSDGACSPLGSIGNHSGDYFGSSWARFKAGSIIGYDQSLCASPAKKKDGTPSDEDQCDANQTSLPTHSFRSFGGLSKTIFQESKDDEEQVEVVADFPTPSPESETSCKSADATPMQSPSVARSLMLRASYFEEPSEDFQVSPLSEKPPSSLRINTEHAAQASSPGLATGSSTEAGETPTQPRPRAPISRDASVTASLMVKLTSPAVIAANASSAAPTSFSDPLVGGAPIGLTTAALMVAQLPSFDSVSNLSPTSDSVCHGHQRCESPSETSGSTTSFASDSDSPPLSWLGGSSGCTSPDHILHHSCSTTSPTSMARSSSNDSQPATDPVSRCTIQRRLSHQQQLRHPITQEDLDRIPSTIAASKAAANATPRISHRDREDGNSSSSSSSGDVGEATRRSKATSRLAARLAMTESSSDSSSPVIDHYIPAGGRRSASEDLPGRSDTDSYADDVSCTESSGSAAEGQFALSSSVGTAKKKKKKKGAVGASRKSAFRCSSFDDCEGALGGF